MKANGQRPVATGPPRAPAAPSPSGPAHGSEALGAAKPLEAAVLPELHLKAPDAVSVEGGRSAALEVEVTAQGLDAPVMVRLERLPRGLESAAQEVPATAGSASAARPGPRAGRAPVRVRLAVRAAADAEEGASSARLVATAGLARHEATVRLDVRPGPAVVARRRGDAAMHRGEYAEAASAYGEAIRLDPADHLAYHGRALAAYHRGDYGRAVADLDAALRIKPEAATALNNRGLTRLARGEPAEALADFDAAVRLEPEYAVVRYNRGRARAGAGDAAGALADYDAAIRFDPKLAKAFRARAAEQSRRGDAARAEADYETVLRLSPSDTVARNNLALLLVARGEPHRAIAELDEAIRIDPRYAVARYNRGRIYLALGDTVEALGSFDQALRLDPTMTRARDARAEVLARPPSPALGSVIRQGPTTRTPTRGGPGVR
jgi:Tfp pilus assembly protein PilF